MHCCPLRLRGVRALPPWGTAQEYSSPTLGSPSLRYPITSIAVVLGAQTMMNCFCDPSHSIDHRKKYVMLFPSITSIGCRGTFYSWVTMMNGFFALHPTQGTPSLWEALEYSITSIGYNDKSWVLLRIGVTIEFWHKETIQTFDQSEKKTKGQKEKRQNTKRPKESLILWCHFQGSFAILC